jgi:hypothetical protein
VLELGRDAGEPHPIRGFISRSLRVHFILINSALKVNTFY